ncbi:MAG: aminopeptidase P family protein [Elusimicrobia bacterium]|nr:aminopeptidase P family protein [Candidatus Obscuribacterium magneticum]
MVDDRALYLAQRVSALRDLLREKKLEGYLLSDLSDIFYVTDFKADGYQALIGLKESWLLLPHLLYDHAKAKTSGYHYLKGRFLPLFKKLIQRAKLKRVGFDPDQLPYSLGMELRKLGLIPKGGLVTTLRAIKDPMELARLRKANHLAAMGIQFIKKRLKPGKREKAVSADLMRFFSLKGDGIAFDLIVAAGPHSAHPHHITSNYRMKSGDAVICDIGAVVEGYRSDLTRTFALGKVSPSFRRVYHVVEKAQQEGIRRLKPGVTAGSVDVAARRVIKKAGFGRFFIHGTGHGVGIDIHERPRLGSGVKDEIKAGMVVTVEPGVYLPGKFGVRIEDTLLVTPTGSEILTL